MPIPLPLSETAGELLLRVTAHFAELRQVEAVVLAGSQAAGQQDAFSDLDIYIYSTASIPNDWRRRLAETFARPESRIEIDNPYWGSEDGWDDSATGLHLDLIYRLTHEIEDALARVLDSHQASVGYSTCFWHNVLNSTPLFDRRGWYAALQHHARQPYPEPLRRAIIWLNYPVLRDAHSSYIAQIESAVRRQDRVSVNHRAAGFLASYFDVLFAVNRATHPGEKRLTAQAEKLELVPPGLEQMVEDLLRECGAEWEGQAILTCLDSLVDSLKFLLLEADLLPS